MNSPQDEAKAVEIEVTTVEPQIEDAKTKVRVEEFSINGDALVSKIKELIHQGNIRRITIKNEEGHTLIEIPLTIGVVGGVVGTAVFPIVAAIGAIGALVAHLTIAIEKVEGS
ncbi:MAG TPA: DUF4342 domain-containing protein [Phormidium sp.]